MIQFTTERREIKISIEDCQGDTTSACDLGQFQIEQLESETYFQKGSFHFEYLDVIKTGHENSPFLRLFQYLQLCKTQ